MRKKIRSLNSLFRQLPEHLCSLKSKAVQDYCFKILHPSLRLKKLEDFSEDTFSVGTYTSLRRSQTNVLDALKKKGKKQFAVCLHYTRCLKKNSYTCSFEGDEKVLYYGSIDIFVKVKSNSVTLIDSDSSKCFAIIQLAKVEPYVVGSKQVHHMKRYFLTPEFIAVDVNNLKDMMVCVEVEEH
ncbi:RNA 3'-terminal phosphate cyclase, partial [Frankliniella fusca]